MIEAVMKRHYDAEELASMRLPGLPTTRPAIFKRAKAENWAFVEVPGKGGRGGIRREYAPPARVMAAIKEQIVGNMIQTPASSSPTALPAVNHLRALGKSVSVLPRASALNESQKRTAEARSALLTEVNRIAQVVGREKAIMKVVIMAQDGSLPEHLAALVPVANAKAGEKRTLSRRTIHRWLAETAKTADGRTDVNALAPKDARPGMAIPPWAADLLAVYQTPQKPSLAYAVEQIAPAYGMDTTRLYHRARRFLQHMGNVELQRGRMGSRDITNIKPFIRRDSSVLWPADVYTADGHTFDAEIAHPVHGRPFRPELTGVVDVHTRRYVGWSVDLAESGLAVLDALRHACETGGIPALFYVDNGSGYHNALMSAPGVGMETRLGFTMTHSIAYNSKARGIIEKSHQSVWVRAAKELPTYIGATMDRQAMQKVHKLTRREVAQAGRSQHLMPFNEFLEFCKARVDAYNNRPHRSLPKLSDPELGRKRHMTPNEAWAKAVTDGAKLVLVEADEARELFRPQREAKVIRGEIKLFGNIYFARELTEYHGDVVRAGYDVHNAHTIWVYDLDGRFVCTAEFEANKRAYFPESFVDQAARKRADGRERRLQNRLEEVRLERDGDALTLENNASPSLRVVSSQDYDLVGRTTSVSAIEFTDAVTVMAPARPMFLLESERYEWLMQNREGWMESDHRFVEQFVRSDVYASLSERFDGLGLAWSDTAAPQRVAT